MASMAVRGVRAHCRRRRGRQWSASSISAMTESIHAPAPAAAGQPATRAFLDAVRAACADGSFDSLVLSKSRAAGDAAKSIRVRRIALKGEPVLSFVATHATRAVTRNLPIDAGLAAVAGHLDPSRADSFA